MTRPRRNILSIQLCILFDLWKSVNFEANSVVYVKTSNGRGVGRVGIRGGENGVELLCVKCKEWQAGTLFFPRSKKQPVPTNQCYKCRRRGRNTGSERQLKDMVDRLKGAKTAREREHKTKIRESVVGLHAAFAQHRALHRRYGRRIEALTMEGGVVPRRLQKAFEFREAKLVEEVAAEKWILAEGKAGRYHDARLVVSQFDKIRWGEVC